MQELKPRCYVKHLSKFITIHNIEFDDDRNMSGAFLSGEESGAAEGTIYYPIGKIEITYWTGLKDKNGKEIYEGDIVKFNSWIKHCFKDEGWKTVKSESQITESIIYFYGNPGTKSGELLSKLCLNEDYELEIISNIYENPNLLENKG